MKRCRESSAGLDISAWMRLRTEGVAEGQGRGPGPARVSMHSQVQGAGAQQHRRVLLGARHPALHACRASAYTQQQL